MNFVILFSTMEAKMTIALKLQNKLAVARYYARNYSYDIASVIMMLSTAYIKPDDSFASTFACMLAFIAGMLMMVKKR